ncbi:MAG: alpha/beta hydrolase [Candidatus Sumerlaeia bacterium]|nr:alpha/beta hydrolase [Candidatus Sumerlaeia bacterium]
MSPRMLFHAAMAAASLLIASARAEDMDGAALNIPYREASDATLDDYARERCVLDLHLPEGVERFPTVVWFHGGGIKGGEKHFPEELRGAGIAVAAVNYRLSPRAKVEDAIDDAAAATAWVLREIESRGGDPERVFVSGHSAGGYLAMMVGLDKSRLPKHGAQPAQLAGIVPFSGHTITHFTIREERGIPDTRPVVDEYAPLYHVAADAPPLLLVTGDREMELLGRYEENAYMARMMKVAGHTRTELRELQGFDHGGMAKPAHELLKAFVRRVGGEERPE